MKRGLKKGQVTVFIIIGILIIGIVGGIIWFTKEDRGDVDYFNQADIKPLLNNIESSILDCSEIVSKDALTVIGVQGGYYNKPAESLDIGWAFIPYYYNEGSYLMPGREKIENELEDYGNDFIFECLDSLNFEDFELSYSKVDTDVGIKDDSVDFKFDMSVTIKREDKRIRFDLEDYPVSQTSALSDILDIADYITESHKIDPKMYCISCVLDLAEERDVYVQNAKIDENSMYIIIGENRTSEEPYLFGFMNKYTGDEVSDDFKLTGADADALPEDTVENE
jgi:hypothetical protein